MDIDKIKNQVLSKFNYSQKYIAEHSTKQGKPLKKLKESQLNIYITDIKNL